MKMKTMLSVAILFSISQFAQAQNAVSASTALKNLPNRWVFKALFEGENDMTSKYTKGFVDGKPKEMNLLKDGTLINMVGDEVINGESTYGWAYLAEDERREKEPFVDFTISSVSNGGKSTEKYSLVSVTENELIYEMKPIHLRWVWVKKTN